MGGIAVFDIDGVLADVRHRLHHLRRRPKRWDLFFALAVDDAVLTPGQEMARAAVDSGLEVVYSTGRPERYRRDTADWLRRQGFPGGDLHMRANRDRRPASVTKVQVAERLAAVSEVSYLVDDDPRVVTALRSAGFTVVHATWMTAEPDMGNPPGANPDVAEAQGLLFEAQEEGKT